MVKVTEKVFLLDGEIERVSVRAQGPGGQNVNKVSTAVQLRFDIRASSLPEAWKARLLARSDRRITREGVVVLRAQRHRTQEQNRAEALERLLALLRTAAAAPKPRTATRPTLGSQRRRGDTKAKRGAQKALRRRVEPESEG